jgi:hypothetical protein
MEVILSSRSLSTRTPLFQFVDSTVLLYESPRLEAGGVRLKWQECACLARYDRNFREMRISQVLPRHNNNTQNAKSKQHSPCFRGRPGTEVVPRNTPPLNILADG